MATTPVIVTCWLDPPLQSDFSLGTAVTWNATFTDRIQRDLYVDPDVVNFIYSASVQIAATTLTYPASIVKDAVGQYHLDLVPSVTGRWILTVTAQDNPGAVATGTSSLELYVVSSAQ